jgi:hypothetical protein
MAVLVIAVVYPTYNPIDPVAKFARAPGGTCGASSTTMAVIIVGTSGHLGFATLETGCN